MKRQYITNILLLVFPVIILLVNIVDLYAVLINGRGDPFDSEFIGPNSIYRSVQFFTYYSATSILVGVSTVICFILRKQRLYYSLVILCKILLLYPILTAEM